MKPKHKRLIIILVSLLSIFSGVTLMLFNMKDSLVFYHTPTEVSQRPELTTKTIRVGGLVKKGSHKPFRTENRFIITDYQNSIEVYYDGLLPDLFRENQGVVAEGRFDGKIFIAKSILAKHDENYMPPEVKRTLEKGKE